MAKVKLDLHDIFNKERAIEDGLKDKILYTRPYDQALIDLIDIALEKQSSADKKRK